MVLVVTGALLIAGCAAKNTAQSTASPAPSPTATAPATQTSAAVAPNLPRLEGKATVQMVVKGAPVTIEIDGTDAPITAGNFIDLVQRGV